MNAIATLQQIRLENILKIIALANLQPSTKRQYQKAITRYLETGQRLDDARALAEYAATLPKSSRAFLKSAIRLWSETAVLEAKSLADPTADIRELFETNQRIQSAVYRAESLSQAIQVPASKGQKAHTWLTQSEVKRLLDSCDPKTLPGQRDRIVLGLLVGAGLRREELAGLTFDDLVMQPIAGKFRAVLNICGKGNKDRVVPINDRLAAALDAWRIQVGGGKIARRITRGGVIGPALSVIGIFQLVRRAGAAIGRAELDPHDLRRTFAQLGFEAGVPVTQISKLLGHSSLATTQKYLNLDLDLGTTASDFIPF